MSTKRRLKWTILPLGVDDEDAVGGRVDRGLEQGDRPLELGERALPAP